MAVTRQRIVEAALKLALEQAYEDITLIAIAQAAGVSHQTVLNHFESKEKVAAAAADLLNRHTLAARAKAVPGDRKGAITILLGEYEQFGDATTRWAMASERLGSLAHLLDEARAHHQEWLERIFSDQLPAGAVGHRRAIQALHAATDVYTWKLLRRDLGLTRDETERIILDLVKGVLARSAARTRQPYQRSR